MALIHAQTWHLWDKPQDFPIASTIKANVHQKNERASNLTKRILIDNSQSQTANTNCAELKKQINTYALPFH